MNPAKFGTLVAELWRVIESSGDPVAIERALMEFRGSVGMEIMPEFNRKYQEQQKAKQAA
jgi:hypothetical protein